MDKFLDWLYHQFDNNLLYRRIIVFFAFVLTYLVTMWSFKYAHAALAAGVADLNIAAIIAAIQVPVTATLTFISKLYWDGRDSSNMDNKILTKE